jgi:hypothetical protein
MDQFKTYVFVCRMLCMCLAELLVRRKKNAASSSSSSSSKSTTEKIEKAEGRVWSCQVCTLENPADFTRYAGFQIDGWMDGLIY